ncbi:mitochondrial ornithine transporter 1-like [Lingula anatina]|uniref:Mitochondrial ornithine transporter 1-like n=1 Tax=Lingula anatina TaxID=7574 RepID=A0A1S3HER2_LINAN|nr:mitochondrial ornithine transporter 1-like [Lingula anatina]XP_013384552.1 mitochondrial ornithine transporter 1-like [Lingula anatina]XP_013384553.1 mitochondrial ornithine transporter 1-like [Lingula anatina]|eukprot:XP_013384551.1 mitochondrial ornithine transporter 1-like [Lingula anatina]
MSQVAVEPRELITPALSQKEKLPHYVDAAIDFIGGTAGGIANVYVGQPLDTVKVKLQTFPTYYKNAWHCFKQTYTKEGIARGLYAGTGPALMANIAENAVLFAAYGQCQKLVAFGVGKSGKVDDLNVVENALSGSCAAVFSSIVLCPTELVKCRLQAMREMAVTGLSEKQRIGPYQLTRQILREEGYRGLFKGLSATFAREVPGYFFFFGGYEITKAFLTPPGKTKDDVGKMA